jgi:hypothetical protein
MHLIELPFRVRVAAAVLLAASCAAQAQTSSRVLTGTQSFSVLRLGPAPFTVLETASPRSSGDDPVSSVVNSSWSNALGGTSSIAFGRAWGSAVPGAIGAFAESGGSGRSVAGLAAGSSGRGSANAAADVTFTDTLVFSVAGLTAGATVLLDWQVAASGTFQATGERVTASGGWRADLGSAGIGDTGGISTENGVETSSNPLLTGVFTTQTSLVLGNAVPLRLNILASVTASGSAGCGITSCLAEVAGDAFGQADLGHTLTWAGIAGLRDSDGAVVDLSRLSVSSSSGFNYLLAYTAPVPEPHTLALWPLGLAAALWLSRRGRPTTARG